MCAYFYFIKPFQSGNKPLLPLNSSLNVSALVSNPRQTKQARFICVRVWINHKCDVISVVNALSAMLNFPKQIVSLGLPQTFRFLTAFLQLNERLRDFHISVEPLMFARPWSENRKGSTSSRTLHFKKFVHSSLVYHDNTFSLKSYEWRNESFGRRETATLFWKTFITCSQGLPAEEEKKLLFSISRKV